MRLDFRILWIDDQPRHVESFAEGIGRRLKESGFQLTKLTAKSLNDVEDMVNDHIQNDCIDLVLVDYDLGDGKGGELALARVRELFPYKDIVFYSALDTERLRKIAYDEKIDGVFFSTRLSLVDDTAKLVDSQLRKILDLDHMRGIVMAATSDIDFMVEESLKCVYDKLSGPDQEALRNKLLVHANKKLERYKSDVEKLEKKSNIEAFVKLRHVYTAHDKLEVLLRELESWADSAGSAYLEKGLVYQKDVVPRRNKLAHSMLKIDPVGKQYLVGVEEDITADGMRDLRRDLIEHRSNIEHIAVLVDAKLD